MFKWIQKKDLVYWLIIVILFSLLSSDIGQIDALHLDNWAFAGTIVSIILAVMAILYTFDQSSTTIHSTRKLEESAVKIEEVSNTLKDNDIKTLVEDLENKITRLISGVQTGVGSRLDNHIDMINELTFRRISNNRPSDSAGELLTKEQWDIYVKKNVVENINLATLALLFIYFIYKTKRKFELMELVEWVQKNTDSKLDSNSMLHAITGSMYVYNTLNVISVSSGIKDKIEVTYFSKTLKECIEEIINDVDDRIIIKLKKEFL